MCWGSFLTANLRIIHREEPATLMPDLAFVPILMLAAFGHGGLGFGFPLMSTPLLVLLMDMRAAILLTLIPTVAINLASILGERHWRQALRTFWPIPVFTILGSFAGTQVLLSVDPEPFRLLLALVLVGYLLSDRLHRSEREHRVPRWGMALFGFGLGLLAGVTNVFAPVIVVYALFTRMDPALMVATFNLSFLTSKAGQIAGFVVRDAFTAEALELTLWALGPVMLSLWLGIRLRKRIDLDTYRRVLKVALWIIAVVLMGDWIRRQ
jgi:uncharacterized membrane protein YfcA